MGNNQGKPHGKCSSAVVASTSCEKRSSVDASLDGIFQALTNDGKCITLDDLSKCVDRDVASMLLNSHSSDQSCSLNRAQFIDACKPIFHSDATYSCCTLFLRSTNVSVTTDAVRQFLRCCSIGACVNCKDEDVKFLDVLTSALTGEAELISAKQLQLSLTNLCPRLCDGLQQSLINGLRTRTKFVTNLSVFDSGLLSEAECWWLACHIPSFYFPSNQNRAKGLNKVDLQAVPWQLLYNCQEHGLSVNRFENKVFNYRSPTITILKMDDGRIFAFGVDEEWKYSPQSWGGNECFLTQILPKCAKVCTGAGLLYFNTKLRSGPSGLFIGPDKKKFDLAINPDFSNVVYIEVWGCGSSDTLVSQEKQKLWEKHQAEKFAKVPLPGNWEENADRAILELAGKTTAHAER